MLTWLEIFTLDVIISITDKDGKPPKQKELYDLGSGLINIELSIQKVDRIFATQLSSNNQLDSIINVLRELEFVEPRGNYQPTEKGRNFLRQLPVDPMRWPLSVPIDNGVILFDEAVYLPSL